MFNHDFVVFRSNGRGDYNFEFTISDPYKNERVKSIDQMLHKTLSKIFAEDHLNSDQMKDLLCAPARTDQNYISMLIPELEPGLSELFPEKDKLSLLWLTVLCCYQDSAELLVRSGADVNELYGSHEYTTPAALNQKSSLLHALLLMYPSPWNERFIGLLIEHGANLRARDSRDRTALHVAASKSRVQAAQLLLEKRADVHDKDKGGATPLLIAAFDSDADLMMPLLIKYGADVTVKSPSGANALHCLACAPCSAHREHAELARVLIEKGVSLDDRENTNKYQPIHMATLKGKNEMVKLFLDLGADVNSRAKDEEFPLFLATKREAPEVILTLLKRGANINQRTIRGSTVLHSACQNSNAWSAGENIRLLLSNGADMFAEDREGNTPLALMEFEDTENLSVKVMLRALAVKKACLQPSIELEDERIIEKRESLWNYYKDCQAQLSRAKSTRYAETCTFFAFFAKCQCEIATFMRNSEFKALLKSYDFEAFSYYAKDIREAFERAESYYDSMVKQEDLINEAVCDIFPHMVVTKVARYILNCDICEKRRIVQAAGKV